MPDDLSVAIDRLRISTQRLNRVSDSATQVIKDVEAFLEDYGTGVAAAVSIGFGGFDTTTVGEPPTWEDWLAYLRLPSGKFGLAIVRRRFDNPEEEVVRAWGECTRDNKLNGLAHLPALLVELANRVHEKADAAEQVLGKVTSLLPPLKKKGGK